MTKAGTFTIHPNGDIVADGFEWDCKLDPDNRKGPQQMACEWAREWIDKALAKMGGENHGME